MNETTTGIWLTPEGHKSLHRELDILTTVKRPEIAERIRASQEHGEFSEDNHELDEVKFEQAFVEQRIAELKGIFGTAQILDPKSISTDTVGIGAYVELEELDLGEKFKIRVVSSFEANPDEDWVSNESPLGDAVMNAKADDIVTVEAPDGAHKYKVHKISR